MTSRDAAVPGEVDRRRPYVLLDRDGTVNVERQYLCDPEQFELLPGSVEGMRKLRAHGIGLVIVSNQSGVGRGYITPDQLDAIHERLETLLGDANLAVDGIYSCPHVPEDGCACRKPETGLVLRASAELGFDPANSFVVGDRQSDIDLGRRLGVMALLVRTGYGMKSLTEGVTPDRVVRDLDEAADVIIRECERRSKATVGSATD